MKNVLRGAGLALLLSLLIAPLASFAQDDEDASNDSDVIVGSRVVTQALDAIAMESDLPYTLDPNGTVAGIEQFCSGNAVATGATRPLSIEEEALCNANNVTFEEYLLGYSTLAIITPQDLTFAECLSPADLDTIFAPSAQGQIIDWAQIGLETTSNVPLTAYLPPRNTALYNLLDQRIDGFELRADAEQRATPDEIISDVRSTPGSIGIVPYSSVQDADGLQIVQLNNPDVQACITPTVETIETGEYDLSESLYLYVNQEFKDLLTDFLTFATTESAGTALLNAGYTQPSDATYALNQQVLAGEEPAGRQFSREVGAFEIPANVSGTVAIGGSASLANFVQRATQSFSQQYPGATANLNIEGQPAAVRRFCSGELDMIFINRDLQANATDDAISELATCENNTITPVTLDLGGQAVVLMGNASTDESFPACLTPEEVLTIWRTDPAAPTTWSDVNEAYPEADLILVMPEAGAVDYTDILLSSGSGPVEPVRLDVAETNNDPAYRAQAVANVASGLTYMSWTDYQDLIENDALPEGVRLLDIYNGDPDVDTCITPDEQTIADQSYTYTLPGRLIISERALVRPEVQSLTWYLFQDSNYGLYDTSGLAGIMFGQLPAIRETLQANFDQAFAADILPPTTTEGNRRVELGPALPFNLFTGEAEPTETETDVTTEATPEATPEAESGDE